MYRIIRCLPGSKDMANMKGLSCLWNMLTMTMVATLFFSAEKGYKAAAKNMKVYGVRTTPVTLIFNNEKGIIKRRIVFNGKIILYYLPQVIVVDEYKERLTHNITDTVVMITLDNTTLSDAGNYTLFKFDVSPEESLSSIQLYIMGKPQKPSVVIENNGIVKKEHGKIKCMTASTSRPSGDNFTYTWRNNYGVIEADGNKYEFEGQGGSILAVRVDRNESLNEYKCSATEVYGITSENSSAVSIDPDRSPLVQMKPDSGVYREIEFRQITLQCHVTDGKPTSYTYQWWTNSNRSQKISPVFAINNSTRADTGMYNCSVDNRIQPAGKGNINLVILYGPEVIGGEMSQEEGHNLTLSCQIESNPKPADGNISWLRPNNSTFNNTGLKLKIPNLVKKDNGTFFCMVVITLKPTNGSPVIKSASATVDVNVLYGPTITLIKNQSIEEGSSTTISCNIQSNPTATNGDVVWTKYGNTTFNHTGLNVSIQSLDRMDQGIFVCSVDITLRPTDGREVVRSAFENVYLQVLYGPTIDKMATFLQEEGKNISIKCTIRSNPAATTDNVTWTKQESILFKQTGHVLFLPFVKREDQGTFVCHVRIQLHPTDEFPVVRNNTETVHIYVLYGPVVNPLTNKSLVEGNTLTVNCTVQSFPIATDDNITWSKQGNSSFFRTGLQLHISPLDRMDNGIFVCRVGIKLEPTDGQPSFRNATETLQLNVKYQPNITYIGIITDDIFEGNDTTAICEANGNPKPTISWVYLENNTAIGNNFTTFLQWNNVSSKLKLKSASCEDTGTYLCQAKNDILFPSKRTVWINVRCGPRLSSIVNEGKNITVGRNESLTYTVMFHAVPEPTFKWTFNKTTLVGFNITTVNDSLPYKSGSMIQKAEITDDDIGHYEVIAENSFGQGKTSFYIIFQREPDQPLLVSHSCTDRPKSAKIEWKAGRNGGLEQIFSIQYKMALDGQFTDSQKEISEDDSREVYSEFIDNLIPGQTYKFRVEAVNAKGKSVSNEVNCTIVDVSQSNNSSAITVIMVVVSIIFILSLLGGSVGVQLFRRRKKQKNEKHLIKRLSANTTEENDEDALKDNPMYVSSGPTATGATYSVVEKSKKTAQSTKMEASTEQAVYAEVVKSNKKGKGNLSRLNKKKTTGEKNDKFIEMGCVYENSNDIKPIKECDVYATSNTADQIKSRKMYQPIKNKDGLVYADLDLSPGPSGHRFVIRGLENRNDYAIIDLTKTAKPLPSDSESEDENKSSAIGNEVENS